MNRLLLCVEKVCLVSKDTLYRDMTGFSPGLKCVESEEEIENDFET